jgi:MerR family redox-sensitive transcriptional activator SoxR
MAVEVHFMSRAPDGELYELSIGEIARRAGVAPSTIRYYESIGLLPKAERIGGQRRYDEEILGTLGFIAVAKNAGFKLREIHRLIDGAGEEGMAPAMRELSERKLPEVDAALELAQARKQWLEMARECDCTVPEECDLFQGAGGQGEGLGVPTRTEGCRRKTP